MGHKIIVERVEAHYEAREVPFGQIYEWHPAYVALECECGGKVTLSATNTITTCPQYGTDLDVDGFLHDLQEREGQLPDNLAHPCSYDAKARADQRLRDEAAYLEGSPWRYNDITEGP
jgi:hypothetical protein